MRKLALLLAFVPGLAFAQVFATAQVRIDLPVVLPQLVVVSPGIQVVPDVDHEVFFVNGFYWARHDRGWVRSKSHRHGWVVVPARHVPPGLVRIPPGHYRRWKPDRDVHWHARHARHDHDRYDGHDRGRHDGRHDRDDDRGKGKDHGGRGKHGR
jgi:hypothetical protein